MTNNNSTGLTWFKSSYSNQQSACVEVAVTGAGVVPVRDSKQAGPVISFSTHSWSAFVVGMKDVRSG
ncbi:DUF397 domain-containing protein [Streptomyces laculatispora]|uniref:DUF397 domain-containing protein n=1 Tax=Streptomyces laculatispora TaxID=887464 RepID=A0ABY9HXT4_9ACTN|nr:DUF397 domain-containing protein [Streptomyces laculatispora]WLQ39380.1 DUF397 domain-containing protein [Streptomyces laculatispora]